MASVTTAKRTKRKPETIINDEAQLHPATFQVAYQGDIIVVRIESLPPSARPRSNRQLAVGNTQGSRHILERGSVYDADVNELQLLISQATGKTISVKYIGPVFVSPDEPTADDLTHPEHGNQGFPAGAVCAVVYQRNMDAEEREAKTAD